MKQISVLSIPCYCGLADETVVIDVVLERVHCLGINEYICKYAKCFEQYANRCSKLSDECRVVTDSAIRAAKKQLSQ